MQFMPRPHRGEGNKQRKHQGDKKLETLKQKLRNEMKNKKAHKAFFMMIYRGRGWHVASAKLKV